MLIDHVGLYLCHNAIWMRAIGRIAMPLFCFMLAEGFRHTKGRRKQYFLRLLIFAFVAQLPFDLSHSLINSQSGIHLNVLFTLTIGFMAMALIEHGKWSMILLPILVVLAEYLNADYGAYGVLMIVGFYVFSQLFKRKKHQIWRWSGYIFVLIGITTLMTVIRNAPIQLFAVFAIFPIILYNGKLGHRLPKYFGYIFYPVHLLVIFWLRLLLFP